MYAIKKQICVNWAYTILYHMQHQQCLTRGLPYARLATKITRFCGVDLKREPKEKMKREFEINIGVALKNTGIYQNTNDTYKYKDHLTTPIPPPAIAPPPAPEGGYTNEAIYNKICSVENFMMTKFRDLLLEFNAYKNRQPVNENVEEEDMEESD